jgi:uncharacterized protein YkwD
MISRTMTPKFGYRRYGCAILWLVPVLIWAGCEATAEPAPRSPTRPAHLGSSGGPPVATPTPAPAIEEPPAEPEACVEVDDPGDSEHRGLYELVNEYRRRNGLNELLYSASLQEAADAYAERMARDDFFEHVAPEGTGPGDRALTAGFCNRYVGENLAYGLNQVATAEEAMQGFIDSPPHNENLLRTRWDYIGIGLWHRVSVDGDEYWWVQLFGDDLID